MEVIEPLATAPAEQIPAKEKKPIINCHTHIFTADHVPPFLAKTFVPAPLHRLLSLSMVVSAFRFYYTIIKPKNFTPENKKKQRARYERKMFIARNLLFKVIVFLLALWLTVHVFFILFDWLTKFIAPDSQVAALVKSAREWLAAHRLLFIPGNGWLKLLMVTIVLLYVKSGRNLILFVFKKVWSFLKILPGPQSRELAKRYLNIGRFSFHTKQYQNYKMLRNQYPQDSGFIVLPMDMEYMQAGKLKKGFQYRDQMASLAKIKADPDYRDRFFPFVFVDPRRIKDEADYFQYSVGDDGKIKLEPCFIKEYMEDKGFSGFKIYPALGYFPFDELLLPLWKYAAENGIPILTHCIRGNIYFRGSKEKAWDYHPVFTQGMGDDNYEELLLPQTKNIDFINNFTHPLNYLCLLDETQLRKCIGRSQDKKLQALFGYTNNDTALTANLEDLKICFGHYGGEDEWKRFLELDRDIYTPQLVKQAGWGIDFLTSSTGEQKKGKIEQIWKVVDWYTIISSMMLQYDNVYSDLSYILHDNEIVPLLSATMQKDGLKKKVLFGTDFYVVRNHKSEKQMLAEMMHHLKGEDFDLIARDNPREFLKNSIHGPVKI